MAESTALTVREVRDKLLAPQVSEAEAAEHLLALPITSRALAIASSFAKALDGVPPQEADAAAEGAGRRLERILESTPGQDQFETLRVMVGAGDTEAVLAMVRGEAGDFSSTAEHLTPELIRELYLKDPDMHRSAHRLERLLTITHTLIVETRGDAAGVNAFFATTFGQRLLWEIREISTAKLGRSGNENADHILREAGERGIPIPRLDEPAPEDEEEDNGDEATGS